jgi:hypothetical protein
MAVARRIQECDSIGDEGRQRQPALQPKCDFHRREWNRLCSNVVVHDRVQSADLTSRVTQSYREAAEAAAAAATDGSSSGAPGPSGLVALRLLSSGLTLGGAVCGVFAWREAVDQGGRGRRTQRLMHARVFGQASVVMTIVGLVGLSKFGT